ncbi:hypothetical protein TNCV_3949181 [Trichonephila clavipes]|nr:hypothetical protein TNCV_3949181 [Trichonephila clavipes]
MRCIGKGAESARMFCGIMNLPRHPQNFKVQPTFYCRQQEKPVNTVWQNREAVDENDGKNDGSWQKRGFSSKNGLVTSVDTGKVIDVEVFQNIVFVRTKPSIFKIVREILKAKR